MRDLRPAGQARRAGLHRLVRRVALIGDEAAGIVLARAEAEGPAADRLADLLERVGRGDPLRHDEGGRVGWAGERGEQAREGAGQPEAQAPVVERGQLGDQRLQLLAVGIALHPALEGGDAIHRPHRLAIMEAQAGPQSESIDPPVILDRMAFGHLRLRPELRIHAV